MFPRKFVPKMKRPDYWRPDYRGFTVFDIKVQLNAGFYAVFIYSYLYILHHYKKCFKSFTT